MRWLIALPIVAVVLAPQAHADQYDFIAEIDSKGVYYQDILGMINDGKGVCRMLRGGASVDAVWDQIVRVGYADGEAPIIIPAAARHMCPDQLQTLQDYADGVGA